MCGIFGFVIPKNDSFSNRKQKALLEHLFLLSETRGKDASGLACVDHQAIHIFKGPYPAHDLLRDKDYKSFIKGYLSERYDPSNDKGEPHVIMGQSRMVTTGTRFEDANNQPIVHGDVIGVHNGIIVNHAQLWNQNFESDTHARNDSAVLVALMDQSMKEKGEAKAALQETFGQIEGMASAAFLFTEYPLLALGTNNGSLYTLFNKNLQIFVFASEINILNEVGEKYFTGIDKKDCRIEKLNPGHFLILNTISLEETVFTKDKNTPFLDKGNVKNKDRKDIFVKTKNTQFTESFLHQSIGLEDQFDESIKSEIASIKKSFPYDPNRNDHLKRCTRCILPETMPFISFDKDGICNYCHSYRKLNYEGKDVLLSKIRPHRNNAPNGDCVVGVSGGRDSLYCLHYLKKELGLNPIAYTYDWGMVTDLARRNISRICEKLGVEHILVSADIQRKRSFIKKNVEAWLQRPNLGMIPLFMAGDKEYFFHLERLRQELGVFMAFMGENRLERTDFKSGFAGVKPYNLDSEHVYTLPVKSKFNLLTFYMSEYLTNPGYMNGSLWDTAKAAFYYYGLKKDYINLYQYIKWDEDEIISTLDRQYGFERAEDTTSTWRIGDGTAAFYNYIYETVCGFNENDTFRSNQIREGVITREQGLNWVKKHNRPRYESIYWYLKIIGVEKRIQEIFAGINQISKRIEGQGL